MIQNLFWHAASTFLSLPVAFGLEGSQQAPGSNDPQAPGVEDPVTSITLFDPLQGLTLQELLKQILSGLTLLAIPVVTIMIIIGAYYLITSGGNPGKRAKGKDYILWAAIGFAVLLLADSVVAIVSNFIQPPATP